jgi:hypothetical protein
MEFEVSPELAREYQRLAHAVQSGIEYLKEYNPNLVNTKHLRTGIDLSKCEESALVRLLIEKGVITADEYFTKVNEVLKEEVKRSEKQLKDIIGTDITLG